MTCRTQRREGLRIRLLLRPSRASRSMQPPCFISLVLISPQIVFFFTNCRASSDVFSSSSFISSKICSQFHSVALLCNLILSCTMPFSIPCLSLNYFHFLHHILTPFFNSTRPFNCAFHLAQLAMHTSSSACLKSQKSCGRYRFLPAGQLA